MITYNIYRLAVSVSVVNCVKMCDVTVYMSFNVLVNSELVF